MPSTALGQGWKQRSNLETLTPRARSGAEAIPVRLDGQPSADDVARGAQVEVAHGRYEAAGMDAERTRCTGGEVLIPAAKDHVARRPFGGYVGEPARPHPSRVCCSRRLFQRCGARRKHW